MNNTNTFNSFYDIEDIKLKSEKYIDCIEEVGNFFLSITMKIHII